MIVCIAEDRFAEETGVKLLILSLESHCPGMKVRLTYPPATEDFRRWVASRPHVQLRTAAIPGAYGWNVKPHALLDALGDGDDDVLWLDSDIIVNRDLRPLFAGLTVETLVVCEETYWGQHQGGTHRTLSWGLVPGRSLSVTANTGVVRVTPYHKGLLHRWRELLETEAYRAVQIIPTLERPIHMLSDQEVLTALLAAKDFTHIPIHFIRRGHEIVQYFGPGGYTLSERIHNLFVGLPPILHAMGRKPWHFDTTPVLRHDPRQYYDALAAELSPYTSVARRYAEQIGEPAWLVRRTLLGTILSALGFGNPSLEGLSLAFVDTVIRQLKHILNIDRYSIDSAPHRM